MLFTSFTFLLFFAVVLLVARRLPWRYTIWWFLLASVAYYGTFGAAGLGALAAVAVVTLGAGRYLARSGAAHREVALWSGIVAILGLLALLKYYDPLVSAVGSLPLTGLSSPPGFSFYAFAAIALLADRYRRVPGSNAGPVDDLLYLVWFPKILAGPIERIRPFAAQLRRPRPLPTAVLVGASQLILWGVVKKVVVADNLAPFVDRTYAIPAYAVPVELIIASYFFAFQIYCDFSGYTDMARGMSRLLGIRLSINFRRSYFATSIGEFWARRWHISLSNWFRDFVYVPIGGKSRRPLRLYTGLMVVFVLSGVWHAGLGYGFGWGFVVWGALNGIYLCAERLMRAPRKWLAAFLAHPAAAFCHRLAARLLVFHLVLVGWVFFRAGNLTDAWTILGRVWAALPELPRLIPQYPFTTEHFALAAIVLGLLTIEAVQEAPRLYYRLAAAPRVLRWGGWYALIFTAILLGRWQGEAFVYMQF